MSAKSTRRSRGQSIIETVVGIMFLVPIVLFLFDIAVLVLTNTANDNLAKSACRAAASATNSSGVGDSPSGFTAAQSVCQSFNLSSAIIHDGKDGTSGKDLLESFSYNGSGWDNSPSQSTPTSQTGQVACVTKMVVHVPIPFPFLPSTVPFEAKDVEPIVSIPPQ